MKHHRWLAAVLCSIACSRETPGPVNVPEATAGPAPAASTNAPSPVAAPATDTAPAASAPAAASAAPTASVASDGLPEKWERVPDIEYVPTPQNVVDKMLEVAKLKKTDLLYDLGCGDGRIVVT